jgi:hypothetical protein
VQRLRAILDGQTNDELVLARDFTGWIGVPGVDRGESDPNWQRFDGVVLQRVTVQVALERTAVVYVPGQVDRKFLVNLERVFVEDAEVRWLPRNPTELRELRSRQQGQVQGRLAHGRLPAAS